MSLDRAACRIRGIESVLNGVQKFLCDRDHAVATTFGPLVLCTEDDAGETSMPRPVTSEAMSMHRSVRLRPRRRAR
jgi:hypothetical protein